MEIDKGGIPLPGQTKTCNPCCVYIKKTKQNDNIENPNIKKDVKKLEEQPECRKKPDKTKRD